MVGYVTRTAQCQGIVTLRMTARAALAAGTGVGGSTWGARPIWTGGAALQMPGAGEDTPTPLGGVAASIRTDGIDPITLVQAPGAYDLLQTQYAAFDDVLYFAAYPLADSGKIVPLWSDVPEGVITAGINVVSLDYAGTPFPQQLLAPPQPILDFGGASVRPALVADASAGNGTLGLFYRETGMVSMTAWDGMDSFMQTHGYGVNFSNYPDVQAQRNYMLWSGVNTGTGGPLLVIADPNGDEITGYRWKLRLDDPTFDMLFQQPAADHAIYQAWSCNSGFVAAFSREQINTVTLLMLNPDCTRYWIYVLIAIDDTTLACFSDPAFGTAGRERIWIDSAAIARGDSGNLMMTGCGATDALRSVLLVNDGASVVLPPFPPIIGLPCTPCAPLAIDGNTWAGRLA